MSAWLWPTTADIGMRVFAKDFPSLLTEAGHGVQMYLMSEESARGLNEHIRRTGEWRIRSEHNPTDEHFLYLAWLDEILYRAEIKNQWYVDAMVKIENDEHGLVAVAQATWVDADLVEREIEIKAVTTHQFEMAEVKEGEVIPSRWDDVPDFEGPGWYADVVFDI
ncbi:MAG: hypothetical protein DWC03_00700 [Candidatus Poseidoniales archaeon]|nr:MAG: hypothetical protein DWC03_00700 [Candidatus Poseidoniales archaeon]